MSFLKSLLGIAATSASIVANSATGNVPDSYDKQYANYEKLQAMERDQDREREAAVANANRLEESSRNDT